MSEVIFNFSDYESIPHLSETYIVAPNHAMPLRLLAVVPNRWINEQVVTFPSEKTKIYLRHEFFSNGKWRLQKEEEITVSKLLQLFRKD